jgi:ABC-type Na+ efflux pump permease subunit
MLQQAMTGQITAQLLLVDTIALAGFSVFFFVVAVLMLERTLRER